MPFRLMEALRKSVAMLVIASACVWGLGCSQDAAKPKPAPGGAAKPVEKKPEDKPAEKKPEDKPKTPDAAGSTTGAGGGTQTP